jgi:hypothetical protein
MADDDGVATVQLKNDELDQANAPLFQARVGHRGPVEPIN